MGTWLASYTVSPRKCLSGNWKTIPTTDANWLGVVADTTLPPRWCWTVMLPDVAEESPAKICIRSILIGYQASIIEAFCQIFAVCRKGLCLHVICQSNADSNTDRYTCCNFLGTAQYTLDSWSTALQRSSILLFKDLAVQYRTDMQILPCGWLRPLSVQSKMYGSKSYSSAGAQRRYPQCRKWGTCRRVVLPAPLRP